VIEATGINGSLARFDGQSVFFVNLVQMSRNANSGDSGGPVYNLAAAFGISTAINGAGHLVYSRIGNVGLDMGITVRKTSAC
jgi:hypothetical protein